MTDQLKEIEALLPTELFAGSKDWREGDVVERVRWLLIMHATARDEVARLQDVIIEGSEI